MARWNVLINHLTPRKTITSSLSPMLSYFTCRSIDRATRFVAVSPESLSPTKASKLRNDAASDHGSSAARTKRMARPTNGLHFPAICIRRSKRQHHSGSRSSSLTAGKAVSICRSRWPPLHVYRLNWDV